MIAIGVSEEKKCFGWNVPGGMYVPLRHGPVNVGSLVRVRVGGGGYNAYEWFWVRFSMKNNLRSSKSGP